ncbi:MAG: methyltransferase type 11 [Actinobacteria bacterium RBG_13_63_9]|nr:MAG: methyltransferase type 11 [Actinobacteria bacterium RBG_13_63_9]
MAQRVCPWWVGYLLISPLRRWFQNPEKILGPHIREGMTVLEIGPGMGFFTIPAAVLVGARGRVITVDVQEKMLNVLMRRAKKYGVAERIDARVCAPDDIGVTEPVDVCLAINVAHEAPDVPALFSQIRSILKPGGKMLLVEPTHHVSEADFQVTLDQALEAGFEVAGTPTISGRRSVLLVAV